MTLTTSMPGEPENAGNGRGEHGESDRPALEPRPTRSSSRDAQRSPQLSAACPRSVGRRRATRTRSTRSASANGARHRADSPPSTPACAMREMTIVRAPGHAAPFHAEQPRSACRRRSQPLLLPDRTGQAGHDPAGRVLLRPESRADRRMRGWPGRVQERPAAYAESPRSLRHKGPAGHLRSLIPGDRNVAIAIARLAPSGE